MYVNRQKLAKAVALAYEDQHREDFKTTESSEPCIVTYDFSEMVGEIITMIEEFTKIELTVEER